MEPDVPHISFTSVLNTNPDEENWDDSVCSIKPDEHSGDIAEALARGATHRTGADENSALTTSTIDDHLGITPCKDPFISRSARLSQSDSEDDSILEDVWKQKDLHIISALTLRRLERQFECRLNLDLRRLLVGDDRLLSGAINFVQNSLGPTLGAVFCIPLPNSLREAIAQVISHGVKSRVNDFLAPFFCNPL
ncbi:unnamed protein product [Protopolystoma xenopodis]|uniref:Vacuolar fusion protein MON1 homolog n=1 Tax=Protopolystoma xenopodis TaxID=117903 RepID=A0A3S5BLB1_9PLAT|nr:unnamed protein product [Protopolystoma xenopodis]